MVEPVETAQVVALTVLIPVTRYLEGGVTVPVPVPVPGPRTRERYMYALDVTVPFRTVMQDASELADRQVLH